MMNKQQLCQKAAVIGAALAISTLPFAAVGTALASGFEPVESSSAIAASDFFATIASPDVPLAAPVDQDESLPETFHTEAAKETDSHEEPVSSKPSPETASTWTEQSITAKHMRTILPCFSREKALEGTRVTDTLAEGQAVTAVASTSTNYYKIKEGGYIYADFLEEAPQEPVSSSAKTPSSSKQDSSQAAAKNNASTKTAAPVVHDGTVRGILNAAPLNPKKTGFASLDNKISAIFDKIFTPGMDTYAKVKACYDYLIQNTSYGRVNYPTTGFGSISPEGGDNYIAWAASSCLEKGIATCNRYSSAFIAMVRTIGLDARYVDGKTSASAGGFIGHVWVEVHIGGTAYVFDPQVEDNITRNGKIQYLRFCKTYSQVPNKYIK